MTLAKKTTKKKAKVKTKAKTKTKAKPSSSTMLDLTDLVDDLIEEGQAQVMGEGHAVRLPGVIPSGIMSYDRRVIGRGGLPMGRVTAIGSKEGGGKTTIALHYMRGVQMIGGFGVYIESERKLDDTLVEATGVDMDRVILSRPMYLEKMISVIKKTVLKVRRMRLESGKRTPCLIVVDSIDGIDAKAVVDAAKKAEKLGKAIESGKHYAPTARVLSEQLPGVVALLEEEAVALLLITQMRMKVGVVMGRKDQMTGGKAIAFYSCLILEPRHIELLKKGESNVIGSRVRMKAIKNQIAAPFVEAEADLIYGKGFDLDASIVEYAYDLGVVTKEGKKSYEFDGAKIGMSLRQSSKLLKKKPDLKAKLIEAIDLEEKALKSEDEDSE